MPIISVYDGHDRVLSQPISHLSLDLQMAG